MKTLKEELQEIVNNNKLSIGSLNRFICRHLSEDNRRMLSKHRGMSKKYAKEFVTGGNSWWAGVGLNDEDYKYVISEKYRFIKDLIAIL